MLDIRLVREEPERIRHNLKQRGALDKLPVLDKLRQADERYRLLLQELETLRHRRNLNTEAMRKRKEEGEPMEKHRKDMALLGGKIKEAEAAAAAEQAEAERLLLALPNLLHESVPPGKDDTENQVIRTWGKRPAFSFAPKGHEELGLGLDILDLERAGKLAGARFYFLKGAGALLDLALQRFALQQLQAQGFLPILPPAMMRREPYQGVVDLHDFEDVMYKVEGDDLYLIATSEHPLVAQYAGEVLPADQLPLKLAGVSACFRREAGSHGKDTKGIFRVHQFNKVEMVILCRPDESWKMHEQLIRLSEGLVQQLELPYRVVNVCTGDIGSIAAKKYDIEAWFPTQGRYRELGSCSNCTDYQARRLRIRFGKRDAPAEGLVHTLNNTGIATTRTIAAILENGQQADGSVRVPRVLQSLVGMKKLEPL
ncbi:MAG: serine--tRNA ligase [Candidatus Aenigmarchaeota archaeon]|nr:serine--tRNA ligase [Candidatus Aenigmarchaeota archaeon]